MTNDDGRKPEGAPERSPKAGAGAPSGVDWNGPKRFSVQRKMAIVARLLRSEPLELVARETNVSIARLTEWRDRALAGAVTALKERERDDRDDNRWLMFALPPEEDIDQTIADVRFVQPKANSCTATKRGIYSITFGARVRGLIRATPLSEGPQSIASSVIVCADPSSRIS